jgi:formylglycine-generating enzyme required for sulfatase activity
MNLKYMIIFVITLQSYSIDDYAYFVEEQREDINATIDMPYRGIVNLDVDPTIIMHSTVGEKIKNSYIVKTMIKINKGSFTEIIGGGVIGTIETRRVDIDYDFEISKYEITKKEFAIFTINSNYTTDAENGEGCYIYDNDNKLVKKSDANWRNPYFEQDDNHPVVCVSWNDAKAYIKWLNNSHRPVANYRLPTKKEWLFVAESENLNCFEPSSVSRIVKPELNCPYDKSHNDKYKNTTPIGSFRPNPKGVYDMTVNVEEWIEKDKENNVCTVGGSWNSVPFHPSDMMSSSIKVTPTYSSSKVGFRILKTAI